MKAVFVYVEAVIIMALVFTVYHQMSVVADAKESLRLADYIIAEQYSEIHACEHAGQDTNYHGSGL